MKEALNASVGPEGAFMALWQSPKIAFARHDTGRPTSTSLVARVAGACIVMVALSTGTLWAQAQQPRDDPQDQQQYVIDKPMIMTGGPFDRSSSAVKRATAVFNEVKQAYRTAMAIRDRMTVTVSVRDAGQSHQQESAAEILITRDSAIVKLDSVLPGEDKARITLTVLDGTMYGEWSAKPQRYYAQDYEPPITMTLFTDLVGGFVFPQFPLMFSEDPLQNVFIHTLQPRIVGLRETRLDPPAGAGPETEGKPVIDLLIEPVVEGADLVMRIDPETHLIMTFEATIFDMQQNEGSGTVIRVTMNPTVESDVPVEEFVVNTDERHEVEMFDMLFVDDSLSSLIGKQIPDFAFEEVSLAAAEQPQPQGKEQAPEPELATVTRESLMGHVILLAVWDAPSNGLYDVLPTLADLRAWANTEGYVMTVVPVNFGDPMEEIRDIVSGLDKPIVCYYDPTNQALMNDLMVRYLPTIAVVAADGTILYVYEGDLKENQSLLPKLKAAVRQAVTKDI